MASPARMTSRTVLDVRSEAKRLLEQVLALPEEERRYIVDAIQGSLAVATQEEIDAAWRAEVVRRAHSLEDGSAVLVDIEDVDRVLAQVLDEA